MRRFSRWWLGLLVAFLPANAFAAAPPDSVAALSDSATTAEDWSVVPEYRIVPGDRLILNFGPGPNSPDDVLREARVRPDGRISVFPVGDVVAAGRTVRDLEGALVQLLAAEFRQPRVTIELADVAGNQVHVLGQVKAPGSYPAGPFMTLSQAIATAGGFSDDAAKNSVMVFHRDGARTVRVARIQLGESMRRGTLDLDVPLSRFDIVYVPRSTIGNIELFVRQVFGPANLGLNTLLVGWELFNVEKVYVGASRPVANTP